MQQQPPVYITIAGGGFSGAAAAIRLLKSNPKRPLHITLLEKTPKTGYGIAYGTTQPLHLLNVPASRMSLFPEEPAHFTDYLITNGYKYLPADFVSREIFGNYVHEMLLKAAEDVCPNITFEALNGNAEYIRLNDAGICEVGVAGGRNLPTDYLIAALGNNPPLLPAYIFHTDTDSIPGYIGNPWSELPHIPADADVLILGTGLTMADMVFSLQAAGHTGKVTAVSTHGMLPEAHKPAQPYPSFFEEIKDLQSTHAIIGIVRRHLKSAAETGSDWRAVVDSLRPHTQQLWQQLPLHEKQLFLKYLNHVWGVARHRMPPVAHDALQELRQTGGLHIEAGRLMGLSTGPDGRPQGDFRHGASVFSRSADFVINCLGPESNFSRIETPFINSLRQNGLIRNDALNLGLDAAPDGALIGTNGLPSACCYTLGAPMKGILWECTAVPEIRVQAKNLSELILTKAGAI